MPGPENLPRRDNGTFDQVVKERAGNQAASDILMFISTHGCAPKDMPCFVQALLAGELLNPANTITSLGGVAHSAYPCFHPKEVRSSRNADASAGAW